MMLAPLALSLLPYSYPVFVIPAKAGNHHPRWRFTQHGLRKFLGQVMDSRLRGNDEVLDGNDEVSDRNDEVRKWRKGL